MNPTLKSCGILLLVLVLTSLALQFFVDVKIVDQSGIRMTLPHTLGTWTGSGLQYCHQEDCLKSFFETELGPNINTCPSCGGPLFNMSRDEWEALPKDTQFRKSRYTRTTNDSLFVTIVLSGRDRESIHRPERCLVGQGLTITRRKVLPVLLPSGRTIHLMVLEHQRNMKTAEGPQVTYGYYSYWFIGVGRETHSHWIRMFWLAWDRVVHSVAHQWAYVSIGGPRESESDEYEKSLREIVSELHAQIVL